MDSKQLTGKKAINKELYKYYNLHIIFNNLELLKNINPEHLNNIIEKLGKSVKEEQEKNESRTPIIDLNNISLGMSNVQGIKIEYK